MIPLSLIQPLTAILALLAALVGVGAYEHHRGYATGRADVQQAWDKERTAQLATAVAASEANRSIEQQRAQAVQEATRNAELAQDAVRVAAVRAVAAGDGLRQRTVAVAAACDRPAVNPGAAPPGPAASSPGDMLADVLRRIEDAAGQLAAVADERGAAGAACVSAYGALAPGLVTFIPH